MKYKEFEAFKEYQYSREPLAEKWGRRAREQDRGAEQYRSSFFRMPRKMFYSGLSFWATVEIETAKRIIGTVGNFSAANRRIYERLSCRAERASLAASLYNCFSQITKVLENTEENDGRWNMRRSLIMLANTLANIDRTLNAQPALGWSESRTLKPLIKPAILKIMNLLLDSPTWNNIFDDAYVKRYINPCIFNLLLPLDNDVDPRIRSIVENRLQREQPIVLNEVAQRGAAARPYFRTPVQHFFTLVRHFFTPVQQAVESDTTLLEKFALDNNLKPKTIEEIGIKLASIQTMNIDFPTKEEIAVVLQEFLRETKQKTSVLNDKEKFFKPLLNSHDSTIQQIPLRSYLPENPEKLIQDAIDIAIATWEENKAPSMLRR